LADLTELQVDASTAGKEELLLLCGTEFGIDADW
jgi:hypothetical protein